MNRWRCNDYFQTLYQWIIGRIYNNWYNNIVLFIWFDFYFQKKRWITKVFIKYLRLRSLYLFFCNDGWGKRLFVVRYEASEVFTISILFLSFYSGTAWFIAMIFVRKNLEMSPITEIPIAISSRSEPVFRSVSIAVAAYDVFTTTWT